MLSIQLYGKKTSGYSFLKKHITDFLDFNELLYEIEEINSVNEFIEDQINSIPCVIIDKKYIVEISKYEHIKKAILVIYKHIIDTVGLNCIKKIIIPFDTSKSSYHAFLQSKQFITHEKYVLQLAFNHEDINKNLKSGQQESLLGKMTEKLEDDYVGDIAHITPIYHTILNQAQWNGFLSMHTHLQTGIVLYNYDSAVIFFDKEFINSFIGSSFTLCLIFDNTYLKKVKDFTKLAKEYDQQLVSASGVSIDNYSWHPSLVDVMENGQDFNVFTKTSLLKDPSLQDDIWYCISKKIPLLII